MKKAIGVIGLGMVGSQVFDWLKDKKFPVFGLDKYKKIGILTEINQAPIIFLCLPTPYSPKTGSDTSALTENIKFFKTPKVFVIKSTVLPGTTDLLQRQYKKHAFLVNPEFLRETTAKTDFRQPTLQLVGYTRQTKKIAASILQLLPKAKTTRILPAAAVELIKYSVNAFLALKVIFANQVYDVTKKLGIDYEVVKECLQNEPRLGQSHLQVFHSGYRGFGGRCLSKDLKALIWFYRKNKVGGQLFRTVEKINHQLLDQQNLSQTLKKYWLKNLNL